MGKERKRHDSPAREKVAPRSGQFGSPDRPIELSMLTRIKPGEVRNPLGAGAPGARRGYIRSRMPELLELTEMEIEARLSPKRRKSLPAGEVIGLQIARSACRNVMRSQDQIIAMEPKEVIVDASVSETDLADRLASLAARSDAPKTNGATHAAGANGSGGVPH